MSFNSDSTRISIGRGRVLLARYSDAGVLGPFIGVGNAPKLEFSTMGDDKVEVTDWQSRTATPLTIISRKRAPEFGLTLMEPNPDNLALLFAADEPGEYTQAATAVTDEAVGVARVGGIYQTAKMLPGALTLTSGATSFVLNTHYVVRDATLGIFEVIALPGGVAAGDALVVDYTPTAVVAGSGYKQVLGAVKSKIEGALKFIGNSDIGPVPFLHIYKCTIEPDGAFPFITSDPAEFGLKITALSDGTHTEMWKYLEVSAT